MIKFPSILFSIIAIVFLTAILLSCENQSINSESRVTPGPAPEPKTSSQMHNFLIGSWRSVGEYFQLNTTFTDDSRFIFKIIQSSKSMDLQELFPGAFAKSQQRAEGKWSATTETLTLKGHRDSGPAELALKWLDGKLNIQIESIQLRRCE